MGSATMAAHPAEAARIRALQAKKDVRVYGDRMSEGGGYAKVGFRNAKTMGDQ